MNTRTGVIFLLALTACSGAGSSGSSPDAAAPDGSNGCATPLIQAAEVCNALYETYCRGLNTCCAPNGGTCTQCTGPGCDSSLLQCRNWLVQAGQIDCSALPYGRDLCPQSARSCLTDVGALTCSEYLSPAGAPFPASCNPLFDQITGRVPPP